METICGQAVGAEDFETVGLVTQRVHLLLTAMCVPVALLWLMAEPVLVAIGQVGGGEGEGGEGGGEHGRHRSRGQSSSP